MQSKPPKASKSVTWLGSSKDDISNFPSTAKQRAGFALREIQEGLNPTDIKPMKEVGAGAYEIRVHDDSNNHFRVIYVAKFEESIYVLHAFHKNTIKTPLDDIRLAKARYRAVLIQIDQKKNGK